MNPLSLLSSLAGGVWGYVAAAVLAGSLAAGSAWYVTHKVDSATLLAVQLADSKAQTVSVTASLNQLQGFISTMHAADNDYSATLSEISIQFSDIKKEFANATVKPLPVDCRPDAGRLRILTAAVTAANSGSVVSK